MYTFSLILNINYLFGKCRNIYSLLITLSIKMMLYLSHQLTSWYSLLGEHRHGWVRGGDSLWDTLMRLRYSWGALGGGLLLRGRWG